MPLQVNYVIPLNLCVHLVLEGWRVTLVTEKRRKKIRFFCVPKQARVVLQHVSREKGKVVFVEGLVVGTLHRGSLIYCKTLFNPSGSTVYFQVYNDEFTGAASSTMSAALHSFCDKANLVYKGAENGRSVFGLTRPVLQAVLQSLYVNEAERNISPLVTSVTLAIRPWLAEEAGLATFLAPYAQIERAASNSTPCRGGRISKKRPCPFELSKDKSLRSMNLDELDRLLKGLFPVLPNQGDMVPSFFTESTTDLSLLQDTHQSVKKIPKLDKQASVDTINWESLPVNELDCFFDHQDSFSLASIWGNEPDESI